MRPTVTAPQSRQGRRRALVNQRASALGNSVEAVKPNALQRHRPCMSPERAIFFNATRGHPAIGPGSETLAVVVLGRPPLVAGRSRVACQVRSLATMMTLLMMSFRNTTTEHSPTSSASQPERQPILISTPILKMILMPSSLTSELELTGR